MHDEHCASSDSTKPFTPSNYPTATTSEIEFYFVVDPTDATLAKLKLHGAPLSMWPGTKGGMQASPREARSIESFRVQRAEVDARLQQVGEQPLSDVEMFAVRIYTGPMFHKYGTPLAAALTRRASLVIRPPSMPRGRYNTTLRAKVSPDNPFFKSQAKICHNNTYKVSIAVLAAAVVKLGKIEQARLVYRAPGGALPTSFWKRNESGVMGGLEAAFMSTTTNMKEALNYANRGSAKVLFEIRQGLVARGASVMWLSQYPTEAEITFPPLTALEMSGSRIDGAVIIVELIASMRPPNSIEAGLESVHRLQQQRLLDEKAAAKRKNLVDMLVRERDEMADAIERLEAEMEAMSDQAALHQAQLDAAAHRSSIKLTASRVQTAMSRLQLEKQALSESQARLQVAQTVEERQQHERALAEQASRQAAQEKLVDELLTKLRQVETESIAREQATQSRSGAEARMRAVKSLLHMWRQDPELTELRARVDALEMERQAMLSASDEEGKGMVKAMGRAEISIMSNVVVARTLGELRAQSARGEHRPALLVVACFERVLELCHGGGGGGGFATDKKTVPSVVALMGVHGSHPMVQLRGCQALQTILNMPTTLQLSRESGALRAVVRALQMLTVPGIALLSHQVTSGQQESMQAVAKAVQECCDFDDPKTERWLGLPPKGWLALPRSWREQNDIVKATEGQEWVSSKQAWRPSRAGRKRVVSGKL